MQDLIFERYNGEEKRHMRVTPMCDRFQNCKYPLLVRHRVDEKQHIAYASIHDFPQLWYCVSGTYTHYLDGKEYEMKPGMVITVPAGAMHGFVAGGERGKCELVCIEAMYTAFQKLLDQKKCNAIANLFLPRFSEELGFEISCVHRLSGEERARAEEIILSLCKHDYNRRIENFGRIVNRLEEFFSLPSFAVDPQKKRRVRHVAQYKLEPVLRAVFYINKNYNKKIHREELLAVSALCQTDFFRLIKKTVGFTYSIYLQMIRISYAQRLISFSPYTFSYIATKCGFGDASYMGKVFRKYSGINMQTERKKRPELMKAFPDIRPNHDFFGIFSEKLEEN